MTKRERIYAKFDGKCAYTGKPLGDNWQIDHMTSKISHRWNVYYAARTPDDIPVMLKEVDKDENLIPALRIVNHYKRSLDLEQFRSRMMTFHIRLGRLPKKTKVPATVKRIAYMNEIAEAFGITPDKPFSGKFYFEKLEEKI